MIEIYDNKGKTVDRYSIYVWPDGVGGDLDKYVITTDGKPNDPQGFWQHGEFDDECVGEDETKISVDDLPMAAQTALLKELV
jgi:hypothetical protein